MKIYYFNDETESVYIAINGLYNQEELRPMTGKLFDIPGSENGLAFVKRWDNRTILMSRMDDPGEE